MNRITVIGAGYVGLVTGTCFAELGNQVVCLDVDTAKIADLNRGVLPLYEPSLEELVRRNAGAGRLSFTTSYADALRDSEFIFIAVNTPAGPTGEADLRYVRQAAASIGKVLRHPATIITKSTVPIGTGDRVDHILARELADKVSFDGGGQPGVPARRLGRRRLPAPRPDSARCGPSRGRRARRRPLSATRLPHPHHRPAERRDD